MSVRHKASYRAADLIDDLKDRFKTAGIDDADTSAKYLVASVFSETNLDKFQNEIADKYLDSEQVRGILWGILPIKIK